MSAIEKILLMEIDSLTLNGRGCYLNNEQLAEFCQTSERTVSRALSHLESLGYVSNDGFNGRQRRIASNIGSLAKLARQGRQNGEAASPDPWRGSIDKLARQGRQNGESGSPLCQNLPNKNNTLNNTYIYKGDSKIGASPEHEDDLPDDDGEASGVESIQAIFSEPKKRGRPRVVFSKPTVAEVKAYCWERRNGIDAEAFVDFYESKGWRVGKEPMKDWKAAVRTWEKRRAAESGPRRGRGGVIIDTEEGDDGMLNGIL